MTRQVLLPELTDFCEEFLKGLSERQVIGLDGPLGAGKTQFVKTCVEILGGETPDSPTFSVINTYQGASCPLFHVDLYRLESEVDIESTGFWDLFREPKGIIFVEWANKIPAEQWPRTWDYKRVNIDFAGRPEARLYGMS